MQSSKTMWFQYKRKGRVLPMPNGWTWSKTRHSLTLKRTSNKITTGRVLALAAQNSLHWFRAIHPLRKKASRNKLIWACNLSTQMPNQLVEQGPPLLLSSIPLNQITKRNGRLKYNSQVCLLGLQQSWFLKTVLKRIIQTNQTSKPTKTSGATWNNRKCKRYCHHLRRNHPCLRIA